MKSIKILKMLFCMGSSNDEKKDKIKSLEIGSPTDFKHIEHVGLSNDMFNDEVCIYMYIIINEHKF